MPDDDEPRLSEETLKALQEFLQEKADREEKNDGIAEDWQLSQFWYDESTTLKLSTAIISLCDKSSKVALISCPTLYPRIKSEIDENELNIKLHLLEYDKRFSIYSPDFEFYDYNEPLNVKSDLKNMFDIVVIDPPFLSKECLSKIVQTVKHIKKVDSKIILCTGRVMEELAQELLEVKKCSFEPKHKNNLANEFICLTNFGELPDA